MLRESLVETRMLWRKSLGYGGRNNYKLTVLVQFGVYLIHFYVLNVLMRVMMPSLEKLNLESCAIFLVHIELSNH